MRSEGWSGGKILVTIERESNFSGDGGRTKWSEPKDGSVGVYTGAVWCPAFDSARLSACACLVACTDALARLCLCKGPSTGCMRRYVDFAHTVACRLG
jgi:hypothetical protein